ncbi:hypothetical protein FCH79_06185 [Pseudomonas koreensis]|nr:hypothetical protein [Pseudomonas koreensis]
MENSGSLKLGWGHCGSELARESGISGNIRVECYKAFASKLAPTGIGFGRLHRVSRQAPQNGGYLKAKRRPLAAV